MDSVFEAFRIVFLFLIVRSAVKMFIQIRIEKVMKKQEQQSEQSAKYKEKTVVIDMVQDKICGKEIPKNKAYIVVKDDERHYFCSWACRERFVKDQSLETLQTTD